VVTQVLDEYLDLTGLDRDRAAAIALVAGLAHTGGGERHRARQSAADATPFNPMNGLAA